MNRNLSDKAKSDELLSKYFAPALFQRSQDKFREGVRTKVSFNFRGKPLEGEYLVSTYNGGMYTLVTTRRDQWLVLTDELERAEEIKEVHNRTSSYGFAFEIRPDEGSPE